MNLVFMHKLIYEYLLIRIRQYLRTNYIKCNTLKIIIILTKKLTLKNINITS